MTSRKAGPRPSKEAPHEGALRFTELKRVFRQPLPFPPSHRPCRESTAYLPFRNGKGRMLRPLDLVVLLKVHSLQQPGYGQIKIANLLGVSSRSVNEAPKRGAAGVAPSRGDGSGARLRAAPRVGASCRPGRPCPLRDAGLGRCAPGGKGARGTVGGRRTEEEAASSISYDLGGGDEVRAADGDLRAFLRDRIESHGREPLFEEGVAAHLEVDAASQARVRIVLQRLQAILNGS